MRDKFITTGALETYQQWFPGHMHKGMVRMEKALENLDLVLEVHDCRIPISGRSNKLFERMVKHKEHLVLLNKSDLVTKEDRKLIIDYYSKTAEKNNILFTQGNADHGSGAHRLLQEIIKRCQCSERFERDAVTEYNIMIVGVPNVGKSSMINRLRNKGVKKASAVQIGKIPGVTRAVSERIKIFDTPKIYLSDTPGVLFPIVKQPETVFKLGLCDALPENLLDYNSLSDYLLFTLNKTNNYSYVDYLKLKQPTDRINEVLYQICFNQNYITEAPKITGQKLSYNFESAAIYFIKGFKQGHYGQFMLDSLK